MLCTASRFVVAPTFASTGQLADDRHVWALHVPEYERVAHERRSTAAHVRVGRPMAFDIQAWSDYGVAVVGGAAALTGLLFVAVSVNSAWFSSSEAHRGRAGQALVLFVVPLVTGLLLLIPGQTTTSLGVEIAAFGLLVGRVLLRLGSAKLKDEPRAIVVIDRLSPRAIITTALIACGASLVVGHFGGLYWLAGAHVGALLVGLLNAWIFLLVAGADKGE